MLRQDNGVEWTELNKGRTRMTRGAKIAITPSSFRTTAPVGTEELRRYPAELD